MKLPITNPTTIHLTFSDVPVTVTSACGHALSMVLTFYGHFATTEPVNSGTCFHIEENIENSVKSLSLSKNGALICCSADLDDFYQSMKEQIFLEAVEALNSKSWLLHCSAGSNDAGTVLLPGFSGSGKTTLLMALITRGLMCCADDMVPLNTLTGLARSFPTAINLREPGRSLFFPDAILTPLVRRGEIIIFQKMVQSLYIDLHERAVVETDQESEIRWIIIPRRQKGVKAKAHRIPSSEALKALLINCYNSRTHIGRSLDVLLDVVKKAECYELVGDDPFDMAQCVENIMRP
jgi:hypothetical protein